MMGSGKTTIGKLLAEELGVDFEDLDTSITRRYKMSINEVFSEHGESFFREAESIALMNSTGIVISCGGGTVLNKNNRRYIKKGLSFFLNVEIDELKKRLKGVRDRPLLDDENLKQSLESLWKKRERVYLQTADHIINVKNKRPKEITKKISGYIK